MRIRNALLSAVLPALLFTACGQASVGPDVMPEDYSEDNMAVSLESFTMGLIPSENAEELTPKADRLAKFLTTEMGMDVEVIVPTTYEPLIEGLKFGHLDAAYMDSGPAWLAHEKTGSEVVLAELKEGEPHYYSEVFVRSDEEEIKTLEDVVGKRIAFTSWTGSSGFIFPVGTMVERGLLTPEGEDFVALEKAIAETFESYTLAGGYKQALDLLVSGQVDVAAGAHDAAEKYLDEADRHKIKSIERLGKVPSHLVMVGTDIERSTEEKFVTAMLKLNEPENLSILTDIYGVDGLIATNTVDHLGDFGPVFNALTGIHDQVLSGDED